MRNSVSNAILIYKRDTGEKDMLLEFITEDMGYLTARDYASQRSGSRSFMLYNTGQIYLYKNESASIYTLKDSKLSKMRKTVLLHENLFNMAGLCECVKFFSKYSLTGLFYATDTALDLLENAADFKKIFIHLVQDFLTKLNGKCDYTHCPVCAKKYSDNEILGYSRELFMPVCEDCADIKSVLLPGVRRYLLFTQSMAYDEVNKIQIHTDALGRVMRYIKFQLKNLNPSGFRSLEFI